jgi:hypothetical protein
MATTTTMTCDQCTQPIAEGADKVTVTIYDSRLMATGEPGAEPDPTPLLSKNVDLHRTCFIEQFSGTVLC